jgi:tRNA G18 (ribose-2'-O)-methylase SpoU
MPHLSQKVAKQIHKTALGAESLVSWRHEPDIIPVIAGLRVDGWQACAIEQAPGSMQLPEYVPRGKIALVVGREVEGIEPEILALMDTVLEIPMFGNKESFNVVQAAAMALYHCRFAP